MPKLRFATRLASLLLSLAAVSGLQAATTIIRGPYLQSPSPTSMVVRWRTDNTEASVVRYGLSRTELTSTAKAEGISAEHVVFLSDLTPNTRYFYTTGAAPAKAASDSMPMQKSWEFTASTPTSMRSG